MIYCPIGWSLILYLRASEVVLGSFALFGHAHTGALPSEDFEFHAQELFHGTGKFSAWSQDKRSALFSDCMTVIGTLDVPIIYGAVDKQKLNKAVYRSANPLDIAFRLCTESIEKVVC